MKPIIYLFLLSLFLILCLSPAQVLSPRVGPTFPYRAPPPDCAAVFASVAVAPAAAVVVVAAAAAAASVAVVAAAAAAVVAARHATFWSKCNSEGDASGQTCMW